MLSLGGGDNNLEKGVLLVKQKLKLLFVKYVTSEKGYQDSVGLFAEKIILWVGDAGLEEWHCPEKKPCPILSFRPLCLSLFFSFLTEQCWFVTWSETQWKQSALTGWHSLSFGARRLLEKHLVLTRTKSQIKYCMGDCLHFGHCKIGTSCYGCCSWGGLSVVLSFWGHGYAKLERADWVVVGWDSLSLCIAVKLQSFCALTSILCELTFRWL